MKSTIVRLLVGTHLICSLALAESFSARLVLNTSTNALDPVKTGLRGLNVQWVDLADSIMTFDPYTYAVGWDMAKLNLIKATAPSMVRYPGGIFADVYRWRESVGSSRPEADRLAPGQKQVIIFGLIEYLEFCEYVGATPLITLNLITAYSGQATEESKADAIADEAASLFEYIQNYNGLSRITQQPLPKVVDFEVGNEPYLSHAGINRPDLNIQPEIFALRAARVLVKMRAAAKNKNVAVKLILPFRNPLLGGIPAAPDYPGFADQVLNTLKAQLSSSPGLFFDGLA